MPPVSGSGLWISRIMAVSLNSQNSGISPIASETRGVSAEMGFLNSFIQINVYLLFEFDWTGDECVWLE